MSDERSVSADTFERSCAHWSEAGRAEMEAFYALATEDYRQLARAVSWRAVFHDLLAARSSSARSPAARCRLREREVSRRAAGPR